MLINLNYSYILASDITNTDYFKKGNLVWNNAGLIVKTAFLQNAFTRTFCGISKNYTKSSYNSSFWDVCENFNEGFQGMLLDVLEFRISELLQFHQMVQFNSSNSNCITVFLRESQEEKHVSSKSVTIQKVGSAS